MRIVRGQKRSIRIEEESNRVALISAFPNGIWERGKVKSSRMRSVDLSVARRSTATCPGHMEVIPPRSNGGWKRGKSSRMRSVDLSVARRSTATLPGQHGGHPSTKHRSLGTKLCFSSDDENGSRTRIQKRWVARRIHRNKDQGDRNSKVRGGRNNKVEVRRNNQEVAGWARVPNSRWGYFGSG